MQQFFRFSKKTNLHHSGLNISIPSPLNHFPARCKGTSVPYFLRFLQSPDCIFRRLQTQKYRNYLQHLLRIQLRVYQRIA